MVFGIWTLQVGFYHAANISSLLTFPEIIFSSFELFMTRLCRVGSVGNVNGVVITRTVPFIGKHQFWSADAKRYILFSCREQTKHSEIISYLNISLTQKLMPHEFNESTNNEKKDIFIKFNSYRSSRICLLSNNYDHCVIKL